MATAALTVTIWTLIFTQLVLGRDPALHSTSAVNATSAGQTGSAASGQPVDGSSAVDSSSAGNAAPGPVATSVS